jgi:hypothetical protein
MPSVSAWTPSPALEGDPTDYDDEAQVVALEVSVAPAA